MQRSDQFLHRLMKRAVSTEVQLKFITHVELEPAMWFVPRFHDQWNDLLVTLDCIYQLCTTNHSR